MAPNKRDANAKPKLKRFLYSPNKVNQALRAISNGMPVLKASKEFKVPRTTLRNKLSGKCPVESHRHCGPDSILGESNEKLLVDWLLNCAKMGFPIDREGLLHSVRKLVDASNIKTPFVNNKPGKKWYYAFLHRHPILSTKHAEYVNKARGTVTEQKIRNWFSEVLELLENSEALNFPERVFNMDETCFCLAPKGGLIIGPRGQNVYSESANSDKENITTLFTVNAMGQFAPPLTIYKYERIPASLAAAAPINWGIGKTENGWMTSESFFEYIANVFVPFLKENSIPLPVIIFIDGHRSHLTLELSRFCRENNLILIALYPNSTHILQPLDVAVFGPLKKMWQKTVRQWRIDNDGKEITKADVPRILSGLIKDPAMPKNIISGFRVTGLYPFNVENVDYSKIVLRQVETLNKADTEDVENHLRYIEAHIEPAILSQFKDAKKKKYDWDGDTKAEMLFDFWLRVAKEADDHNSDKNHCHVTANSPVILQNQSPEITINHRSSSEVKTPEVTLEATSSQDNSLHCDDADHFTLNINEASTFHNNSSQHDVDVQPSISTIIMPPKRNLASIFADIVPWPRQKHSIRKRKKEYTPSVITSDRWVEYHELKNQEKVEQQKLKDQRKRERELKKEERNKKITTSKSSKKKQMEETTSEEEEEWVESGSSIDDIDDENEEPGGPHFFSVEDLSRGDYILASFKSIGKRASSTYKYVSKILQVLPEDDYEVQGLHSLDQSKVAFKYIDNDVSVINKLDILGKLPEPQCIQDGRIIKMVFPASIDVYEK